MMLKKKLKVDKGIRVSLPFVCNASKKYINSSVPPLVDLNGSLVQESRAKENVFLSISVTISTFNDSNFNFQ